MPREACHHAEGNDPRRANRCVRCDALMFEPRDLDLEESVLERACRGHVDHGPILEAMRTRAALSEYGGDRIRVGVDWLREAVQESPDKINYLIWGRCQHLTELDADSHAQLDLALREITSAFNRVQLVRARLNGAGD